MSNRQGKINVLASVYSLDRNDVGGSSILYEWISRLAEHVNLTVITTGAKLNEDCGLEDRSEIELIKLPPRFSFKRWDVFDRMVHPGYVEYFIRARKVINKLVRKRPFDLCHHFSPQSIRWPCPFIDVDIPYIAGPFSGGLKTPRVMNELKGKEGLLVKLRGIDRFRLRFDPWLRKHYSRASRLVVMADYLKEVLEPVVKDEKKFAIIPQPPTKLPELCDIDKLRDHKSKDEINMIFVGRVIPRKGIELLIEAMGRVKNEKVKLSIYGKGHFKQMYMDMTEERGLGDRINWAGFVPNEKIHQAMVQSDIFAFPSLKEPTGIVISEAMGLGLPVVYVDYGGAAYVLNDECGVGVPLGSKEEMVAKLAEAIDYLADNPEIRRKISQAGIDRIQKYFSWEAVVKKMLEVYEEVIEENRN